MTFSPDSKRHGAFTLVELLTVIAIIAVLMGLLLPVISIAMEHARKAKAKGDAVGIVNAVKGYHTDYGKYPVDSAGSSDTTYTNGNAALMRVLTGKDEDLNPRDITFMEVPQAKGDRKSGMKSDGEFVDPWGNSYKVAIDTNHDDELSDPKGGANLDTGVIAWCLGKSNDESKKDEWVVSWQ